MSGAQTTNGKERRPERTCAACRERAGNQELIRWVRAEDGSVVPDLRGRSFGRGAWIHARPSCLKKLQPALQKSFRASVVTSTPEALLLLKQAAETQIRRLLGDARRQGLLAFGGDRTSEQWASGRAHMVILASDARAAGQAQFIEEAIEAKKLHIWGTKAELGGLFDRAEIGVLCVTDRGLAQRLFGAIAMALLVRNPPLGAVDSENKSGNSGEVE